MAFTPDYQAALDEFDKREAEIASNLAFFKQTKSPQEYNRLEAMFAKQIQQMNERRELLPKFIEQQKKDKDKEEDSTSSL